MVSAGLMVNAGSYKNRGIDECEGYSGNTKKYRFRGRMALVRQRCCSPPGKAAGSPAMEGRKMAPGLPAPSIINS
jgi:hypothetical protein